MLRVPYSYELIIGGYGNTKFGLYLNGSILQEFDYLDMLDCDEFRRYWVSWEDAQLMVCLSILYISFLKFVKQG